MQNRINFIPGKADKEWLREVIKSIRNKSEDNYWKTKLNYYIQGELDNTTFHLGIFIEPYLGFILEGKKTIESRFSVTRTAPYNRVNSGDVLLIKRSAGPITALATISEGWSYILDNDSWREIKTDYINALCIQDPNFWESKKDASYATLMTLENVAPIRPIEFHKKDRRGWLVLNNRNNQMSIE